MTKSLSVIGAGYLGVTHAACLAELGFDVVCVERDPDRVEMLNRGELPFYEPGLPELEAWRALVRELPRRDRATAAA